MFGITRLRSKRWLPPLLISTCLAVSVLVTYKALKFAQLFGKLGEHAGIRTAQSDILRDFNSAPPGSRTQRIPKIIHQIFHNWQNPDDSSLREDWARARQSCIDLNPDWEVRLWTTTDSREFIAKLYPWFLETYEGYKYSIQRIDSLRYFLLRHYGGIYQDLDNGCRLGLEALTNMSAFTTDGDIGALSNNILGGEPDHPLFHIITDSLPSWNRDYHAPYATIMYGSGQWMFTAMWERYHWLLRTSENGTIAGYEMLGDGFEPLNRIINSHLPGADPILFWTQEAGRTWSQGDGWFFDWVGRNIFPLIAASLALAALLAVSCLVCGKWRQRLALRRRQIEEYEKFVGDEVA